MRIFDNPNHPQYGPVRRMWIILVQLDLLESAEAYRYLAEDRSWDHSLSRMIDRGTDEPMAQRVMLRRVMDHC